MAHSKRALLDADDTASLLSFGEAETAVIFADYQNFMVGRADPGTDAAFIHTAISIRAWAEQRNIPVIFATVDFEQLPSPKSKFHGSAGPLMEVWKSKPELGKVHAGLSKSGTKSSAEYHIVKRRLGLVSVLSSDGIGDILNRLGTKSIIVAGLSTSGCVLSTTRDASEHDYVVTVVEDACADPEPGLHDALAKSVLPMTANVVTLEELKQAWTKKD